MARTLKDKELGSREARSRLKIRPKPYYRAIERNLHLGYRRLRAKSGSWIARHYLGAQRYEVEVIGVADDLSDADGLVVLDFHQAVAKARQRMLERAQGAAGDVGPLTVKQALERYLQWASDKGKPIGDVTYRINSLIVPALGKIEVAKLTSDTIHDWHVSLSKRVRPGDADLTKEERDRRRRASANRTLTVLRAALTRAWRDGKVASRDAWQRVQPFGNVNAARERHLSVAECVRLVNASEPSFRLLVQAALQTGCRYGELGRLRVRDFNPDAGTLAIWASKSGKPRHVVLTEEGVAFFTQVCAGRASDEIMLVKANGTAWEKSHQATPMRDACERARIVPAVSFHILRHTWASLAIMAGMPLPVAATNLGHTDTRMVERHYGHLSKGYVESAVRANAPRFGFEVEAKIVALR